MLSEGFAANLSTLPALQFRCRLSNEEAAKVCGVSLRTYRRWLSTGKPNPLAVRFLAVLAGYVPWDGWQGWEVHGGFLFPPGYSKNGIPPGEFFAVPYYRQAVSANRERVQEFEAELQALKRKKA